MWYDEKKRSSRSIRQTAAKSAPKLRPPATEPTSTQLHNRHCRCIDEAMHSYQGFKKWTINPNSDLLSTMNNYVPIQQRAKDILEARNYRLQLQRDMKERKQKEIQDQQMEKQEGHKRRRRKEEEKLPVFGSTFENQIKREMKIEYDLLKLQELKEMELLRIAMLKQQQLESSLVARLKQLSPYVRRTHYLDNDFIPTPTNLRRNSRVIPAHPDSSPPYFKTNDRVSPKAFSPHSKLKGHIRPQHINKYLAELHKQKVGQPYSFSPEDNSTKRQQKKLPKTPRQLRKILQNNREEIATFLEDIITRNL